MKNYILAFFAIGLLAGCASTPTSMTKDSAAPTYSEKISTVPAAQFRTISACPADGKWETLEWRKLVPFANACVKAGDWRKVESMGNSLAIRAHLTPWGAYFLSLAAQARKDYPRAHWMLELALKKAPNEGLFQYQMGRLHWDQGNEAAAIKHLKQASDMNPTLIEAHYLMGALASNRSENSEAERYLRKALAIDADHFPSVLAMANLKIKTKDWPKAESNLEHAIRLNPRHAGARLALAQLRESQMNKLGDALSTYKDIRSLHQRHKLDEPVQMNLDEKIANLEKNIRIVRQPSANGKVAQ